MIWTRVFDYKGNVVGMCRGLVAIDICTRTSDRKVTYLVWYGNCYVGSATTLDKAKELGLKAHRRKPVEKIVPWLGI